MTHRNLMLFLAATLLSAASARMAHCDTARLHATFVTSSGGVIELDTRTGILSTPHSRGTGLRDCSDEFQTCLTDHHGFAFAYFRKCNDVEIGSYNRLDFPPRIVSALHDDLWMVFDAAPNYMFHYVIPKGIVGIYVGATPSFDFRSILHDRTFRLASLDAMEYRIAGSGALAACSE